ncbi:NAD(P)-dependent dehydrogenase (short-subunit alcohol dehydrogenase family) [Paraburkholderia sp. BL23I1N1]|uniref:SDR family NAD(P)-dependent oxidoreductase n=1 Tax=Paraburkholderia sp. BL23I1N1 TaxID=1938802 RepID=UPI000E72DFEB|nr:SDR family NAD(P)-dependent oxidoreductase [Paraburkholderia sp. BL23I1N1]RKE37694.1 NAD(P)-dependent dehydrogenase (short-subunit alcohol dehydrogenase family) [Paraburkholderia sp. BL23I1N1]
MKHSSGDKAPTILLIGASRGLGHAMAAELLKKGWNAVGTTRPIEGRTQLHDLADENPGRVEVETVDICEPEQIAALRARLSGRMFDILFVNAGTANANPNDTIGEVSTEEFIRVMVANALGPMRMVEALQDLVPRDGLIGVMSSGQGSIANNTNGGFEVYRGSKSALNQYMRSYAARHASEPRALVLMAPGWIRTALGGPNAPSGLEETIPDIVNTLLSKRGKPGLAYLDRMGRTVPW